MLSLLPILALSLAGCSDKTTALSDLDERYLPIMVRLGQTSRDTARDVHNSEFRKEKVQAEKTQIAFFQDVEVQRVIQAGLSSSNGSLDLAKAQAYHRQMIALQAWTRDDRVDEARILSRLEAANAERRSSGSVFSTEDGKTFNLGGGWSHLMEEARSLSIAHRQELVQQYVDHRMRVLGSDLQQLVRLRNEVARRAGYANYWELALAQQGLGQSDVDQLVGELEALVQPYQQNMRDRRNHVSQMTGLPNNLANRNLIDLYAGDPLQEMDPDSWYDGDRAEERIRQAFQDMGFRTTDWEIHTGPVRRFRPGAYAFPIHPPDRVSVVMGSDRQMSMWPYMALAHEGGLATWWQGLDAEHAASPVLWQPTAPWFEGYGGFFERLIYEPDFSEKYVSDVPVEARESLRQSRARGTASSITTHLIQVAAEKALYEDPTSLEAVCRLASQRRQELTYNPAAPTSEDGLVYEPTLLSAILWNYPGYSPNFLYAYLAEAWLFEAVQQSLGSPVANGRVATYIGKNLVQSSPGLSFPDRLSAMYSTERSQPLKDYLSSVSGLPAIPTELPWYGPPKLVEASTDTPETPPTE